MNKLKLVDPPMIWVGKRKKAETIEWARCLLKSCKNILRSYEKTPDGWVPGTINQNSPAYVPPKAGCRYRKPRP